MSKSPKSRDRITKNSKPNEAPRSNSVDRDRESEAEDLLNPQWVEFGESFRLSDRELEVLILTSRGMPRKTMARELKVSLDTVNTYCDRLHKKINVEDRVGLMRLLVRFIRSRNATEP